MLTISSSGIVLGMLESPPEPLLSRVGYLLKHAQLRLSAAIAEALAPFGIDGRGLAVLLVLSTEYPMSQLEAAGRLNVDRTTMVALIDGLEDKGYVVRRRSTEDRRKNVVELTDSGRDCLHRAEEARARVERRFLAPIGQEGADRLIRDLQVLLTSGDVEGGGDREEA
ncbi:DNA-binding transcriptional regulator, MarR family [Amycolatopsis sacchari]|uniref:DNA-binding transcriptional regulator, MarR family n=1 Tax=Amycolatopsis sacchari TaxID=115433 RepID=A0A1I4DAS0_9PSEU|nr:DNA-binding transcriptional regulator, MarR family [Amycolatopsis sacchari]